MRFTKAGLKCLITCFYLIIILAIISILWQSHMIDNQLKLFGLLLGGIAFIIFPIFMVGITFLWKGRKEFGKFHEKLIKIGIVLFATAFFLMFSLQLFVQREIYMWLRHYIPILGSISIFLFVCALEDRTGRTILYSALASLILLHSVSKVLPPLLSSIFSFVPTSLFLFAYHRAIKN